MRLCITCRKNKAEVPDREALGRLIKRLCLECHRKRLTRDLLNISNITKGAKDE